MSPCSSEWRGPRPSPPSSSTLRRPLSEASRTEGHRESLSTSEKRLILFAPTLTGPLILQVYLSSEHLAPLTTWPALLSAALLSRAGLGPASVTVSNYGTARSHRKCELLVKWLARSLAACAPPQMCLDNPGDSQGRVALMGFPLAWGKLAAQSWAKVISFDSGSCSGSAIVRWSIEMFMLMCFKGLRCTWIGASSFFMHWMRLLMAPGELFTVCLRCRALLHREEKHVDHACKSLQQLTLPNKPTESFSPSKNLKDAH